MLHLLGSMFQKGQDSSFCANLRPPRQTGASSQVTHAHGKRFLVLLCSYSHCFHHPCLCQCTVSMLMQYELSGNHVFPLTSLQINSSFLFLLGLQTAQLHDSVGITFSDCTVQSPAKKDVSSFPQLVDWDPPDLDVPAQVPSQEVSASSILGCASPSSV